MRASRPLAIRAGGGYVGNTIPESDRLLIGQLARKYGVRQVLAFGSAATGEPNPHDIDLAVEGLAPAQFFGFYGELLCALSLLPVDRVDLSQSGGFSDLVRKAGVRVYDGSRVA